MKILFMADVPPNPDSGAAGTEFQTIEALRRQGHEVYTVWADDLPHRIKHGNLHYLIELPHAYKEIMLEKLRSCDFDVIHVNQPHGYLAAKHLKQHNVKSVFIHRSHGFELRVARDLAPWMKLYGNDTRPASRKYISKIMTRLLTYNSKRIALYADGHIVSASQCGEFLNTVLGVPQDKIAVIPQAPPNLFRELPTMCMGKERLKRSLHVGQFAFLKAPMIVASVMNRLADMGTDLEFTWVCSASHHSQVLELLDKKVRDRIVLLDWMPQQELLNVYDRHGIFLFPSFFEGFGKAFIEAMSRGLCVIAADNGGAHDVIRNEDNGILVPTGTIEGVVNACLQVMENPEVGIKLSEAAIKTARAYTWDRVAKETLLFYQSRLEAKAKEISPV